MSPLCVPPGFLVVIVRVAYYIGRRNVAARVASGHIARINFNYAAIPRTIIRAPSSAAIAFVLSEPQPRQVRSIWGEGGGRGRGFFILFLSRVLAQRSTAYLQLSHMSRISYVSYYIFFKRHLTSIRSAIISRSFARASPHSFVCTL